MHLDTQGIVGWVNGIIMVKIPGIMPATPKIRWPLNQEVDRVGGNA
jgi:hypothetical protein